MLSKSLGLMIAFMFNGGSSCILVFLDVHHINNLILEAGNIWKRFQALMYLSLAFDLTSHVMLACDCSTSILKMFCTVLRGECSRTKGAKVLKYPANLGLF